MLISYVSRILLRFYTQSTKNGLLFFRSSEGSSSSSATTSPSSTAKQQIASESTSSDQSNSNEFSDLEKVNHSLDIRGKTTITNNNNINNIIHGQNDHSKTDDQTTRHDTSESSTIDHQQPNNQSLGNEIDDMKRAHAKQLIERYFYQLSTGCGNPYCINKNCASSGQFEALTPNQAAARAIQLFSEDAKLCNDFTSNKSVRITDETDSAIQNTNQDFDDDLYR